MTALGRRLFISIAAVLVWVALTVGLNQLQAGPGSSLAELVSSGFVFATPGAVLFMALFIHANGWWKDVGLNGPRPPGSLLLLWFPSLYLIGFLVVVLGNPLPPASVISFVLINTLIVGFSEELAFRGMLWGSVRRSMSFWRGFALVSVLFGSVHILNGFMTGEWAASVVQAVNAAASGAAYLAIRIRTRSLVPIVVFHGLWDFALFVMSAAAAQSAGPPPGFIEQLGGGAVLVGPIFLYGLFLVRNERVRGDWTNDALEAAN